MLLKLFIIFAVNFSLFASDNFVILKSKDSYSLSKSKFKYELTYSGVPKILKVSKVKSLDIIDYYSGSFGTTDILKINNRVVIKNNKVIIDAPYKYVNKSVQPVWVIDHAKGFIEIKDPIGTNQKVEIK